MNHALARETLRGRVIDVGGGRGPTYVKYFKKADHGCTIVPVDYSLSGIDFEKDILPFPDGGADTVVCCNVLEHIYNFPFLMGEMSRILKPGAQLIGFVPFWVGYHPDPHDYFRYTNEALARICLDAGLKVEHITAVGAGPFVANFNTIVLSVPRVLRPILYVPYVVLDALFVKIRPASRARNPLGYIFVASK
jgi:SAM-dependent methyltransferase